ncbi:MAG TPA: hypothetical protein VIY53_12085 [Acidobacteriaceae bacterium]
MIGRLPRSASFFPLALGPLLVAAGCGSNSGMQTPTLYPITITLSSASATIPDGGSASPLSVTVNRVALDTNPVTLTLSGYPYGVLPQITQPGTGSSGNITLSALAGTSPGTSTVTVSATEGGPSVTAPLSLTVLSAPVTVNVSVSSTVNTSLGFNGQMQTMMSTQFQAAEWAQSFFPSVPSATTTLADLHPQHIRVYTNSLGIPQRADKSWDFTVLDATLDPVIGVGDKNINLVLVEGPPSMCTDVGPNCVLEPQNYPDFATYAARMVQYYNTTTGFTDDSGVQHVHTPFTPITYWSIYTIPDLVGMTPAQYANLYNLTVTAMQKAGSLVPLKFVALELSGVTDANDYAPGFLEAVTAQIDVVSQQQYAVCGWQNTDAAAMGTVPYTFGQYARDFAHIVATSPKLSHAVLWMTENNVDADFSIGNGQGECSNPFEVDQRGTSPFFAGWRPYVFSQWAQAGSHMLVHSDFVQDASTMSLMYAEVTYDAGQPYLSYWVDDYLGRYFPWCAPDEPASWCTAQPVSILTWTTSEPADAQSVEIFATRNADGSVVVMAANHAVNSPNDDNGPGAPRTIVLDLSQLPAFSSATELTIDANISIMAGPQAVPATPQSQMTLNMGGYGVTFLKLLP